MNKVCFFKLFKLYSFQKPPVLSKEVFGYVSTKREAHKMSKVCFLKLFKFKAFKSLWFCQKKSLSTFPPSGQLTKWAEFAFWCFLILELSKTTGFAKRGLWVHFHQAGIDCKRVERTKKKKILCLCLWGKVCFWELRPLFLRYQLIDIKN